MRSTKDNLLANNMINQLKNEEKYVGLVIVDHDSNISFSNGDYELLQTNKDHIRLIVSNILTQMDREKVKLSTKSISIVNTTHKITLVPMEDESYIACLFLI